MIVIVMGVTGCGKTTVGQLLAERLAWDFYDADAFHPAENVEKMRQGIALNDLDRLPWLRRLQQLIKDEDRKNASFVLACSALKREYRDLLREAEVASQFAFLHGEFATIKTRLEARSGHYMNPELLQSQFEALEEPDADECAIHISVSDHPEAITEEILRQLTLREHESTKTCV